MYASRPYQSAAFLLLAFLSASPSYSLPATDVVCSGCVGTTDIANHSITSVKIKNGTIRAADIASNAITSSRIVNGEVKNADIAINAIRSGNIKNGEVKSADIAVGAIRSGNIKNGEVRTLDLANNAVTFNKLSIALQNSLTAGGGLAHTVNVSGNLSPSANGTALLDAVAFVTSQSPTQANPWVIKIDAGNFDIGASTLTLPGNIRIEGSGKQSTFITGTNQIFYCDLGRVTIADLSTITQLGQPITTAEFLDYDVTLERVNFTNPYRGLLDITSLKLTINNSELFTNNTAVFANFSTTEINNSLIARIAGTTSLLSPSIRSYGPASRVMLNHSQVSPFEITSGEFLINHTKVEADSPTLDAIVIQPSSSDATISINHSDIVGNIRSNGTSATRTLSAQHSTINGYFHGVAGTDLSLDLKYVTFIGITTNIVNKTCLYTSPSCL